MIIKSVNDVLKYSILAHSWSSVATGDINIYSLSPPLSHDHCWVLLWSWRTFATKAIASSSPQLVLQQDSTPRCWQQPSAPDGLAENLVSGIYWRGLSSGPEIVRDFSLILTVLSQCNYPSPPCKHDHKLLGHFFFSFWYSWRPPNK